MGHSRDGLAPLARKENFPMTFHVRIGTIYKYNKRDSNLITTNIYKLTLLLLNILLSGF